MLAAHLGWRKGCVHNSLQCSYKMQCVPDLFVRLILTLRVAFASLHSNRAQLIRTRMHPTISHPVAVAGLASLASCARVHKSATSPEISTINNFQPFPSTNIFDHVVSSGPRACEHLVVFTNTEKGHSCKHFQWHTTSIYQTVRYRMQAALGGHPHASPALMDTNT